MGLHVGRLLILKHTFQWWPYHGNIIVMMTLLSWWHCHQGNLYYVAITWMFMADVHHVATVVVHVNLPYPGRVGPKGVRKIHNLEIQHTIHTSTATITFMKYILLFQYISVLFQSVYLSGGWRCLDIGGPDNRSLTVILLNMVICHKC